MYGLRYRGQYPQPVESELDAMLSALRAWLTVDHNEDGTHNLRPSGFDFVPIGAMMQWGSDTAPERWLVCNGDAVSRTTYQGLFAIIGTTYGAGDGSTTFNLPDFRQRFALSKAASGTGATLGSTGGSIDHTHTLTGGVTGAAGGFSTSTSGSGGHSHTVSGSSGFDQGGSISVQVQGGGPVASINGHTHDFSGSTSSANDHTHGVDVSDHVHSLGSGGTTGSNPAYVVVNTIILAGV